MDFRTEFDKKLDANPRLPAGFRDALVNCVDTLSFAWAGARSVFADAAKPEHALTLLAEVMKERARILSSEESDD